MIYDTIKNLKNSSALNPAFDAIAQFVEENDMKAMERYLEKELSDGDLLITMGAGDVYKIGYELAGK